MILNKKINQQRADVELRLRQAQGALRQKNTPQPLQLESFSSPKGGRRHPLTLLAWSFVAGSVAACVSTREKKETTAHAMEKVTGALKTGVAAIALARTMGDLTGNTTPVGTTPTTEKFNGSDHQQGLNESPAPALHRSYYQ